MFKKIFEFRILILQSKHVKAPCSLWFDQGHMHEENLKWTVTVNYWQSLITPAIISSAALSSYWHHKTVIIKLDFKYS